MSDPHSDQYTSAAVAELQPEPDSSAGHEQAQSERDRKLRQMAMAASAMTVVGYGLCQVFRLGQNIVVSHFVIPKVFGLFTLLNVCLQGLFMFSDLGVGPSIVQHKNGDDERFLNTAWTIQIIRSLILWTATLLIAYPFAKFYGNSRLIWLLPVTGFASMLDGLTSTSVFTAQRRMHIGRLVLLDVISQVLGSVVACVWAMYSPTVLALLSASFVAMGTRMIGSHFLIKGGVRNRLCWDKQAFDEVFSFGKWILLSTMIAFCAMQVDRLVLARLVDDGLLGLYGVAFAISMLPVVSMQKVCGHVLHPLLAQYQRNSGKEMRHQFHHVRGALLAIALFLVVGIYACSETFFSAVYADAYQGAGRIAKMLAVTTWVSAVTATVVRVIFVLGDSRVLAVSSAVKFVTTAILSVFGHYQWGMPGFIGGLVGGNVLGYLVLLYSIRKENINCLTQDVKYSLLFLALALVVDYGHGYADSLLLRLPGVQSVKLAWISEDTTLGGIAVSILVCLCMLGWVVRKGQLLLADRQSAQAN